MAHRTGNLVVCLMAVVSAAVLAATSFVIDSGSVPVTSASEVQVVRGYYSALNEYLQSGRLEGLNIFLRDLTDPEAGTMPQPTDQLGAAVELSALRATYPQLRYRIVAIDDVGDAVVAGVAAHHGKQTLPTWIDISGSAGTSPVPVHIRIEEGAISETARNAGGLPAYVAMVESGAQFRMETPARLTIAELSISNSDTTTEYLPLPGPGVFIVQSGSLAVIGDGLAEMVTLATSEPVGVPVGAERVAKPGDAIIVPLDNTIVRIGERTEATLLAAVMVPIEPDPKRSSEREHLDQARMSIGLLDLLRQLPEGVQPIWFGTAEVLSGQPAVTKSGWVSLEVGWLVVPPGEELVLRNEGWRMTLHAEADRLMINSASWGETSITNQGDGTALVLVARADEAEDAPKS